MDILFGLVGFVLLILLGLVAGTFNEQRHFRSLRRREAATTGVLVTQLRSEAGARQVPGARMGVLQNAGGMLGLEEAACGVALLGG